MRLLKVKHYRQKPSWCGPASLKILLSFFGIEETEEKLGRLAGCTLKDGTAHEALIKVARDHGFKVTAKQGATLKDLDHWVNKRRLPVMVGWFSEYDDHYSVVIGLTKDYVILNNPEKDKPNHKLESEFFKNVWFDFLGKNDDRVCWGWMMAIEPKKT